MNPKQAVFHLNQEGIRLPMTVRGKQRYATAFRLGATYNIVKPRTSIFADHYEFATAGDCLAAAHKIAPITEWEPVPTRQETA